MERKGHLREEDLNDQFVDFSVINCDFVLAKTNPLFLDETSLNTHWMSFAMLVFCRPACPGRGASFHIHGVLVRNVLV